MQLHRPLIFFDLETTGTNTATPHYPDRRRQGHDRRPAGRKEPALPTALAAVRYVTDCKGTCPAAFVIKSIKASTLITF